MTEGKTALLSLSALQLSERLRKKEIKVSEALDCVFAAIDEREKDLNCYITIDREGACRQAKKVQERIDRGLDVGVLTGVPVAVKDNICTKGLRTTCASRMLEDFIPPYDATVVEKLRAEGCIIIGKTNMDEFAFGQSTETSYFGRTKNPLDEKRSPGGSSGGSAAAVSACEAFIALGSDTGGSVRNPAACCGIMGIKPTYGRVSRYGLVAYASSMDQIGVLAKNTYDAAAMLSVISGYDRRDSTSAENSDFGMRELLGLNSFMKGGPGNEGSPDRNELRSKTGILKSNIISGLRIGIPEDFMDKGISESVKNAVLNAAEALKECGADITFFRIGYTEYLTAAYYLIADAECSSNLARFDGIRYGYRSKAPCDGDYNKLYAISRSEGFGSEVKRRIMAGCFVLSEGYYDEYFNRAQKVRTLIKDSYDKAFREYDLILMPAAASCAPYACLNEDPVTAYDNDIFTVSANLAGLPAMSIPFGTDESGLPVSVQLIADRFREDVIMQTAVILEGV